MQENSAQAFALSSSHSGDPRVLFDKLASLRKLTMCPEQPSKWRGEHSEVDEELGGAGERGTWQPFSFLARSGTVKF